MRLTVGLSIALLAFVPSSTEANPPETPVETDPRSDPEEDLLGELVVEAKRRSALVLPKLAVLRPPEGTDPFLHDILERDLELSGEFDVIQLDRPMGFDDPFDATEFQGLGLEAVVAAKTRKQDDGKVELAVRIYLPAVGDFAAWSSTDAGVASESRLVAHRLSDGIIGALTGTDGPFASRLVLVRTEGKARRAYLVDADGDGLTAVSPDDHLVVTATLDRDAHPYWAASRNHGRYRLYREGQSEPIPVSPSGSIYGIAFAPNGTDIALSIATEDDIEMFVGPLGSGALELRSNVDFALGPTFTRDGRVVYAGTRGNKRRIYVEAKSISPKDISASTPTLCEHPDGRRLIYAVGLGKNTDLVASKLDGGDMTRLTWGSGRNFSPACSPDGRLVAFFSTRSQDDGPGLYLMRVDGRRPNQINAAIGDVLAWARVPRRPPSAIVPEGEAERDTNEPDTANEPDDAAPDAVTELETNEQELGTDDQ
jgi:TolB protein